MTGDLTHSNASCWSKYRWFLLSNHKQVDDQIIDHLYRPFMVQLIYQIYLEVKKWLVYTLLVLYLYGRNEHLMSKL